MYMCVYIVIYIHIHPYKYMYILNSISDLLKIQDFAHSGISQRPGFHKFKAINLYMTAADSFCCGKK